MKTLAPLPIDIDTNAFAAIGAAQVEDCPVQLPKMTDVRLGTVLKRLTAQIKGDQYVGTYLIRRDRVELTSTYQWIVEAGADGNPPAGVGAVAEDDRIVPLEMGYFGTFRRMTTVVYIDCERQSLKAALRDLAEDSGYNIVIDPRSADKAKTPITLALNHVWLDNAVTLMTEMAELDWYWMDQVIYVTSKENAKQHKDKVKASNEQRARPQAAGKGTVNVNCKDQPLVDVFQGLAGIQTVVDGRVAEKANKAVTAKLDRVPPATAVHILADLADLGVVSLDGVFYVTSKENAKAMQTK